MVDTNWAERRGRMVKCKIHGLHFDPEMSTGCTRCLRDAAKAQPKRPPQLVLILLCLLGMAFILLYLFGPGQQQTAPPDLGVASLQGSDAQRLDPEPYRQPIQALETSLFQAPIDETEDLLVISGDISSSASHLSQRILENEPREGLTVADLIARLGQAIPTNQVTLSDVQRARLQWLRIRKERLLAADWFVEPSIATADSNTTSVAQYSAIASDLRFLIDDGLGQVQSLNDTATNTDDESSTGSWRAFVRDWNDQLSRLSSRMPSRPSARAEAQLLVAIQDLEQALSQARALASEANLPSASDNRFEEAMNAALRAQQGFDDLQF